MGLTHLIDTNAVIDYLGGCLPAKGKELMDNIRPAISVITKIELLSGRHIPPTDMEKIKRFISNADVYEVLDDTIVQQTAEIRQKYKTKTPDAIIASTAIVNNLTLITRNTSDFISIPGLTILDPHIP